MKEFRLLDWRNTPSRSWEQFLERQEQVWEERLLDLEPDTLIITRHLPTITIGVRPLAGELAHIRTVPPEWLGEGDDEKLFRRASEFLWETAALHLVKIPRGGSVWYHDSGVLELYLVMELDSGFPSEVVKPLEETLFQTVAALGLPAERVDKRFGHEKQSFIGVWVGGKKIAAIGLRVKSCGRKKITQFGAALNVSPYMPKARLINPCGIAGAEITSLDEEFLARKMAAPSEQRVIGVFLRKFQEVFQRKLPPTQYIETLYY